MILPQNLLFNGQNSIACCTVLYSKKRKSIRYSMDPLFIKSIGEMYSNGSFLLVIDLVKIETKTLEQSLTLTYAAYSC